MTLADLGKREMAFIYAVALLLSGALLYALVVSPELERYRTTHRLYYSQQQRDMRISNRRNVLLKEYQSLRTKADKAQKLLFSKYGAENFLEMLPKLSKQTGNILTSITPQESHAIKQENPKGSKQGEENAPSPLTEIAEMPVGITITGEYGNIIRLFDTLEGFKQLMAISDVRVNAAAREQSEVQTSFQLNLIHTKSDIKAPAGDILASGLIVNQVTKAPEILRKTVQQTTVYSSSHTPKALEPMKEAAEQIAISRSGLSAGRRGSVR